MKRNKLLLVFILVLMLCVSCATFFNQGEKEYVYKQEIIDIDKDLEELYLTRPSSYVPDIPEETYEFQTVNDLEICLVATEELLEEWEDYSFRLEYFLQRLAEELKNPIGEE